MFVSLSLLIFFSHTFLSPSVKIIISDLLLYFKYQLVFVMANILSFTYLYIYEKNNFETTKPKLAFVSLLCANPAICYQRFLFYCTHNFHLVLTFISSSPFSLTPEHHLFYESTMRGVVMGSSVSSVIYQHILYRSSRWWVMYNSNFMRSLYFDSQRGKGFYHSAGKCL